MVREFLVNQDFRRTTVGHPMEQLGAESHGAQVILRPFRVSVSVGDLRAYSIRHPIGQVRKLGVAIKPLRAILGGQRANVKILYGNSVLTREFRTEWSSPQINLDATRLIADLISGIETKQFRYVSHSRTIEVRIYEDNFWRCMGGRLCGDDSLQDIVPLTCGDCIQFAKQVNCVRE